MNQLGVVDEVVTVLSLIGAVVAFCMSCRASRHGLLRFRPVHAAIAVLSAVYVAGYLWLLLGNPTVVLWSSVMRGFSMVAWLVVWVVPAWLSLRVNRELHAAIRKRHQQDQEDVR